MISGKRVVLELPLSLLGFANVCPSDEIEFRYPDDFGVVAYGSYPCDWNGGRSFRDFDGRATYYRDETGASCVSIAAMMDTAEPQDIVRKNAQNIIKDAVSLANSRGMPFYATMTNLLPLDSDNVQEVFDFLGMLSGGLDGNGVIVAHPEIHRKISSRYGDSLRYVSSVIRAYADQSFDYKRAFSDFDFVTLKPEDVLGEDRNLNHNFLDSLTTEQKSRSIIMLNHACARDCRYAKSHYMNFSIEEKQVPPDVKKENIACFGRGVLVLTRNQAQELSSMGFPAFKFGRSPSVIDLVRHYFPDVENVGSQVVCHAEY